MKLKDIKKDQVFWECHSGMNIKCIALEDAYEFNNLGRQSYKCLVRGEWENNSKEYEMMATEGWDQYAPRLYEKPAYYDPKQVDGYINNYIPEGYDGPVETLSGAGSKVNISDKIPVWKVSFEGNHYYTDILPDFSELECGEIVTEEEMSRADYENLPEFLGF